MKYKLKRHIKRHTGEKPYECRTCNRLFSDSSNFRRHTISHTGEKPFPCPVLGCGKAYSRNRTLLNHLKEKHKQGSEQAVSL